MCLRHEFLQKAKFTLRLQDLELEPAEEHTTAENPSPEHVIISVEPDIPDHWEAPTAEAPPPVTTETDTPPGIWEIPVITDWDSPAQLDRWTTADKDTTWEEEQW